MLLRSTRHTILAPPPKVVMPSVLKSVTVTAVVAALSISSATATAHHARTRPPQGEGDDVNNCGLFDLYTGKNVMGYDFKSFGAPGWTACCHQCADWFAGRCKAFTWVDGPLGGTCYLKDYYVPLDKGGQTFNDCDSDAGCVSGLLPLQL